LAGSDWVAEPPNRVAAIPLFGLSGPITVLGQQFANLPAMTAFGYLSDEDIANVLSYVRSSFGNKASPVTPQEVKVVRDSLAGHNGLKNARRNSRLRPYSF
jgi:mono/diheme cytochrome c family protein